MTINHPRKETHLDRHSRLPYDGVDTNSFQVFQILEEKGRFKTRKTTIRKVSMSSHRQIVGRWGENVAAEYLEKKGYKIVERNVHAARGEIDIVARKDNLLIFVEVRTRTSHSFSYPEESVTLRKQTYILSAAEEYLLLHPESGDSWQFDLVAVEGSPGGNPQIEHFENILG
jgi:putative endonuclease